MDQGASRRRAVELWKEGYERHMRAFAFANQDCDEQARDELLEAVELYSQSIDVCPTAEAYTFRGWALRSFGKIDDAIEQCRRAIEVDPDFGNPYNDIGAYLISKGDLDGAIEWLEKAKGAARYEPRHYPYMNLGRVYETKGMVLKAVEEFEQALKLSRDPVSSESIRRSLAKLRTVLN